MPYDPGPLQSDLTDYFRTRRGQDYFAWPGWLGQIPITADERAEAEQRFGLISRLSLLALPIVLVAMFPVMFVLGDRFDPNVDHPYARMLLFIALGFVLQLLVFGRWMVANLALHGLKARLRTDQRVRRGWRRVGLSGALRQQGIPPIIQLKFALAIVAGIAMTGPDAVRHMAVSDHGQRIAAVVHASASGGRRCVLRYGWQWDGRAYRDWRESCRMAARYPVGSSFPLDLAAERPAYAVPAEETLMEDGAVFGLLLFSGSGLLILLLQLPMALQFRPVPAGPDEEADGDA